MKILISGINGFLGTHLKKYYPTRNVRGIDRELLYDYQGLRNFLISEQPNYIFHFASYGNMATQLNPLQTVRANIDSTANMLMASNDIDYSAFLYISTSSVYGEKTHAMHETNSLEPKTYYASCKAAAEIIAKAHVEHFNKPVVIVRPFSVYGPGEADFRLIPTIIRCIKNREPMKLAEGKHDWIYIEDFISGLLAILDNINNLKGKAVNIGTGQQWDNYEVLKHLCYIAHVDPKDLPIEHFGKLRTYQMWVADNTLLRSLGWRQRFSLSDGLQKCWEAYVK